MAVPVSLYMMSCGVILLACLLSRIAIRGKPDGPPIISYEGVYYYEPTRVRMPSSVEEIQAIIADARDKGKTIRPLGSGHSWNSMAVSDDIYISLHRYRGLVNVDSNRKQITVRGGTRIWEINEIAQRYNLALSVLPSVSNQTIGGALATGIIQCNGILLYH
jgi:FAD/FMN-containing dehydrogenase